MEDALVLLGYISHTPEFDLVLILVLMEDALVPEWQEINKSQLTFES